MLDSLAPLIGAESELGDRAVSQGWADGASGQKLEEWKKEGLKLRDELDRVAQESISVEYGRLMRKVSWTLYHLLPCFDHEHLVIQRLALRRQDSTDEIRIFKPLLDMMENHRLDFHSTFRTLSVFRPSMLLEKQPDGNMTNGTSSPALQDFITKLLAMTPEPERLDHTVAAGEWLAWLEIYARRIENEREEWVRADLSDTDRGVDFDKERERAARAANPRFVLRQWVLEEVIPRVEKDTESGKRVLAKVLHVSLLVLWLEASV